MLTPHQLQKLPKNIVDLYQQLEDFIIADFSRRVAKAGTITDTAKWQMERAEEFGMAEQTLKKKIAETLNISKKEIDDLFKESAIKSIDSDDTLYEQAKLTPIHLEESPQLKEYLVTATEQTKGELRNITQSLGFCVRGANGKVRNKRLTNYYQDALDLAQFQVSSGVLNYNTAIRNAVRSISESGVQYINYESGWRNRVDVAVRRATLTGANQMSQKMTDHMMNELIPNKDKQYVEVSAHSGARPSHAKWQGKVYKVYGSDSEYDNLYSATGLGSGDGLLGWNCRHSYAPFIPGVSVPTYTKEQLKNIDPKPIGYKGRTYTHYEATQYQRQIETAMRQTKRELIGYKEAGLKDDFTAASIKLQRQRQEYREFSKVAKLKTKNERTQVLGYDKSISQKAVWSNRKYKDDLDIAKIKYSNDRLKQEYKNTLNDGFKSYENRISKLPPRYKKYFNKNSVIEYKITNEKDKPFWYDSKSGIIKINPDNKVFNEYEFDLAIFHEVGHKFDHTLFKATENINFKDAISKTSVRILNNIEEVQKAYDKLIEINDNVCLSDILSILTKDNMDNLLAAHPKGYFDNELKNIQEIVANMFSIGCENDKEIMKFINKFMPDLLNEYNLILEGGI